MGGRGESGESGDWAVQDLAADERGTDTMPDSSFMQEGRTGIRILSGLARVILVWEQAASEWKLQACPTCHYSLI